MQWRKLWNGFSKFSPKNGSNWNLRVFSKTDKEKFNVSFTFKIEYHEFGSWVFISQFSFVLNHTNERIHLPIHTRIHALTHSIYNLTLICDTSKHLQSFNEIGDSHWHCNGLASANWWWCFLFALYFHEYGMRMRIRKMKL